MGWSFRRGLKFGPLRINLSKSGVGYSLGSQLFRWGKNSKGTDYVSSSIPGTGIYYRENLKKDESGFNEPGPEVASNKTQPPPEMEIDLDHEIPVTEVDFNQRALNWMISSEQVQVTVGFVSLMVLGYFFSKGENAAVWILIAAASVILIDIFYQLARKPESFLRRSDFFNSVWYLPKMKLAADSWQGYSEILSVRQQERKKNNDEYRRQEKLLNHLTNLSPKEAVFKYQQEFLNKETAYYVSSDEKFILVLHFAQCREGEALARQILDAEILFNDFQIDLATALLSAVKGQLGAAQSILAPHLRSRTNESMAVKHFTEYVMALCFFHAGYVDESVQHFKSCQKRHPGFWDTEKYLEKLIGWKKKKSQQSESSDEDESENDFENLDPYEVLGLASDANHDEIVAAYRKLIVQYHPDKVASLGEELQKLAKQKTQMFNWAYQSLTKRSA